MKQGLFLVLAFSALALAACAPAASAPTASACPTPAADQQLLSNPEDGYCLLYPAGDVAISPRLIVINPISAAGDMPGEAWVQIEAEAAAGRTAGAVADEQIASAGPGFNIERTELQAGGETAVVVDGLPGPDPWRRVFIVHQDRLYTLSFQPWVGAGPLVDLYMLVIESLHFLPPGS